MESGELEVSHPYTNSSSTYKRDTDMWSSTAITAIKARAPVLGGNFGVWGGMFSTFDCAVKGMRKKEDPWNAIIAGFFTGGALAVRGGPRAIRNGAIGCAILLAVIEGVGIGFQRMMADSTKLEMPPPPPSSNGSEGTLAVGA